jgi:hypothetical protein
MLPGTPSKFHKVSGVSTSLLNSQTDGPKLKKQEERNEAAKMMILSVAAS